MAANLLSDAIERWGVESGLPRGALPDRETLRRWFPGLARAGATSAELADWEERFGHALPESLRGWLRISNGFPANGSIVHPLRAIGPMVAFSGPGDPFLQPESWFELGNPSSESETICVDLGYTWPGGDRDHPIFVSGNAERGWAPRVVASGFGEWFLGLIRAGGREYWRGEGACPGLGDPWECHRRLAPMPELPAGLAVHEERLGAWLRRGAAVEERALGQALGLDAESVELLLRRYQHRHGRGFGGGNGVSGSGSGSRGSGDSGLDPDLENGSRPGARG